MLLRVLQPDFRLRCDAGELTRGGDADVKGTGIFYADSVNSFGKIGSFQHSDSKEIGNFIFFQCRSFWECQRSAVWLNKGDVRIGVGTRAEEGGMFGILQQFEADVNRLAWLDDCVLD